MRIHNSPAVNLENKDLSYNSMDEDFQNVSTLIHTRVQKRWGNLKNQSINN